jgi:hypothetical protein
MGSKCVERALHQLLMPINGIRPHSRLEVLDDRVFLGRLGDEVAQQGLSLVDDKIWRDRPLAGIGNHFFSQPFQHVLGGYQSADESSGLVDARQRVIVFQQTGQLDVGTVHLGHRVGFEYRAIDRQIGCAVIHQVRDVLDLAVPE